MTLRVLHAIDSLTMGGAQVMLASILQEMAERPELESHVLVTSDRPVEPELGERISAATEGVCTVAGDLSDPRLLGRVHAEAREICPDLMHSHLATASVTTRIAARRLGVPHVSTLHTAPGPMFEGGRKRAFADRSTAWLSALLTAPSERIAQECARNFRLSDHRFEVIPNAAAARPLPPGFEPAALRADVGVGERERVVVCVSRLEPEKGLVDLVDAALVLGTEMPDLRVLIAGEGSDRSAVEARIEATGAAAFVRLLGHRSDVGGLLAIADAFCLPSRHEGVPLSLIEAMAAGVPVVATAVGGIFDLAAQAALLVPPESPGELAGALGRLADHPALAQRLAARGREVAAAHSPDVVVDRYADVYERLAAQDRQRR